jgi:hypothetical protein
MDSEKLRPISGIDFGRLGTNKTSILLEIQVIRNIRAQKMQ